MLNLSMNEQKLFVGGKYYVHVINKKTSSLMKVRSFSSYREAKRYADSQVRAGYRTYIRG